MIMYYDGSLVSKINLDKATSNYEKETPVTDKGKTIRSGISLSEYFRAHDMVIQGKFASVGQAAKLLGVEKPTVSRFWAHMAIPPNNPLPKCLIRTENHGTLSEEELVRAYNTKINGVNPSIRDLGRILGFNQMRILRKLCSIGLRPHYAVSMGRTDQAEKQKSTQVL